MIGTKCETETADPFMDGRKALHVPRRMGGSRSGAHASDYAGMSNEKDGGNPSHRKSKVSRARFVRPGLAGP